MNFQKKKRLDTPVSLGIYDTFTFKLNLRSKFLDLLVLNLNSLISGRITVKCLLFIVTYFDKKLYKFNYICPWKYYRQVYVSSAVLIPHTDQLVWYRQRYINKRFPPAEHSKLPRHGNKKVTFTILLLFIIIIFFFLNF